MTVFVLLYLCSQLDGPTALNLAAENGHTECVRLLVESGADREAKEYVRGARIDINVFVHYLQLCDWLLSVFVLQMHYDKQAWRKCVPLYWLNTGNKCAYYRCRTEARRL